MAVNSGIKILYSLLQSYQFTSIHINNTEIHMTVCCQQWFLPVSFTLMCPGREVII